MPGNLLHSSISEMGEIPLMRHLISDWHWGEPIRHAFGGSEDCKYYLEVPLQGLAKGDIDVLAVNPKNPQEALAIQIKRIKVKGKTFQTGNPNKLNELIKLVNQTNDVVNLGFWKTCACVIVVVDSRENNKGAAESLEGLTEELNSTIESSISSLRLHSSSGLLHIELVQPKDCPPLSTGTISCHMRSLAQEQSQPMQITEWVSRVVEERQPE